MGLFGFGKKKESAKPADKAPVEESAINREEALAKVEELRGQLEGKEGAALANVFNEIGKIYVDLDCVDEAIEAFEQSLEANHVMGKASATLVKLYNKKRAAAAEAKDDEGIKYYLDKVNEMLAISKNQLRGM